MFTLKGNPGSGSIDLAAGVGNYYMATEYSKDQYQVYTFKGELRKDNCSDCGPSLKIMLRNYTYQYPFDITQADAPREYPYYYGVSPVDSLYTVSLLNTSTGTGTPAHSWDFGNSTGSAQQHPIVTFNTGGIYTFTSNEAYSNGCSSTLAQPVFLTPTRVGKSIDFNVNYRDTHRLMFNVIPLDQSASISWDFGDSQTGTGAIDTHQYAASGIYKVCVLYVKGPDTAQLCQNVNTEDITACKANFKPYTSLAIDSLQLSKVTVEWRDESGVLYSSDKIRQPSTSKFKITEAKNYMENEKGQKTRQLTVEFNCTVSNGSSTIELNNMQGVIAIAYP